MDSQLLFQIQNVLILALIFVGLFFRKQRSRHVPIMVSAICWDLLLILQIEFTRHAIDKAMKAPSNPMLLNIHVALAVSTVIMYAAVFYTGRKLLKGDGTLRAWHKRLGLVTVVLRTTTLATSFLAVQESV
jgi:hypothetical protein